MEKYAGVEPSEQVANRLVAETQLKMEFARKLLDQYAWDFEATYHQCMGCLLFRNCKDAAVVI